MNVPKLRFKEFSNDWKDEKLEDVVDFLDDRRKPIKDSDRNNIKGIYPYYGASGIIDYINDYIFDEELLLLGEDGANILSRSTQLVFKATGKYWVNNHAHVLRPKENYNIDFLESCLENINYEPYNTGTAQPKLNQEVCRKINIKTPSLKEQVKIGKTLSLLDKKIELQTKKIEVLKLFKKGLLNSFFKKRQPNVTIENCISYGKAGGTPSSKNKDYYDGSIPFLSISDMTSQKKYILKTEKSISQQGIKNSSAWIVPKNSIILSMYASYGLIAINKIELATSQAMFSMIVNSKNNIEYIYYYLEFLYNNSYYDRLVSIGTQANLNADKVKKIKIYLPDINSQNKISKILKLCDERIEYENKTELELRNFKKGLMQNMFI